MQNLTENISHNYYLQKKVDYQARKYVKVIDNLFSSLYPNIKYHITLTPSDEFDNFNRVYFSFIDVMFLNVSDLPVYKPTNFSPAFGVYDLNTDRIIDTIEKWEICETIYSYVPDALPFVKIKFLKIPSTFMSKEILEWDFRSDYYQFEAQRMLKKQRGDIMRSYMVQF
jgi:hypothetical protein